MGQKPSFILPGLWQGGSQVLGDNQWFVEHGITHTLSVCPDTPRVQHQMEVLHIDVYDMPKVKLRPMFEGAVTTSCPIGG